MSNNELWKEKKKNKKKEVFQKIVLYLLMVLSIGIMCYGFWLKNN